MGRVDERPRTEVDPAPYASERRASKNRVVEVPGIGNWDGRCESFAEPRRSQNVTVEPLFEILSQPSRIDCDARRGVPQIRKVDVEVFDHSPSSSHNRTPIPVRVRHTAILG